MVVIVGYLLALVVGLVLGLIGGGGAILTVPILHYLFDLPPYLATSYSLFIVGVTALVATWRYYSQGYVQPMTAISFGIPSAIVVGVMRRYVMPLLPPHVAIYGDWGISRDHLLMVCFAVTMVAAAWSMIRPRRLIHRELAIGQSLDLHQSWGLIRNGIIVGAVAGFLGAGGGFLIVPALVLFGGIAMKDAIGTSLLIIAFQSLVGFACDVTLHAELQWELLGSFTLAALGGMLVGTKIGGHISGESLRPLFGWFVLVLGTAIFLLEIFGF